MSDCTIRDAWGNVHTGKLVKRYPLGITIDDAWDVRHYATFDRVVSMPDPNAVWTPPAPVTLPPITATHQGMLF